MRKTAMKRTAIGLILSLICLCFAAPVSAQDVVQIENDRITVTVPASPGEICLVTVVAADYTSGEINQEIPEKLSYQGEFTTAANGECVISFRMSPRTESGEYILRVRPKNTGVQEIPFAYYSTFEKDLIVEEINRSTQSEILRLLRENREVLGLTLGASAATDVTEVYMRVAQAVENGTQFAPATLLQYYKESMVLEAIAQSDSVFMLESGLLTHDDITRLSQTEGYALYQAGLSSAGINAVHRALFGQNFDNIAQLQTELKKQAILQGFLNNIKSGYGHVEDIITEYRSVLVKDFGISFSDYNALSDKDRFHRELLAKSFNTPEELRNAFEALASQLNSGSGTGGGSGGGGSGSRGSSTSFAMITDGTTGNTGGSGTENEAASGVSSDPLFDDIADVAWARESIHALAESGVINGKENRIFAPNDLVTREEFVKMIVLALGLQTDGAEISMSDVEAGAWYAEYVAAAAAQGIVTGYEDGSFGVGRSITREEMAVIAHRAGVKAGKAFAADVSGSFADDSDISDYAKISIYTMQQAGVINGMGDNTFAPMQSCTRAQAAKVVYGLLNQ